MSALGDVLERLFGPPRPVTIHALVDETRNQEVAERVAEEAAERAPQVNDVPLAIRLMILPLRVWGSTIGRRSGGLAGPTSTSQLEVWKSTDGRMRVERRWATPEGPERLLSLGALGSSQRPEKMDIRTFDRQRNRQLRAAGVWPAPSDGDADRLFQPRQLHEIIAALELAATGESVVAGRPVVEVTARERPGALLWPQWLPFGAHDFLLAFDLEHGHLLRVAGRVDGAIFEANECVGSSMGRAFPTGCSNTRNCQQRVSSRARDHGRRELATSSRRIRALCQQVVRHGGSSQPEGWPRSVTRRRRDPLVSCASSSVRSPPSVAGLLLRLRIRSCGRLIVS